MTLHFPRATTVLVDPTNAWRERMLAPGSFGARPPLRSRGICPASHGAVWGEGHLAVGESPRCPKPCNLDLSAVSCFLVLCAEGTVEPFGVYRALDCLAKASAAPDAPGGRAPAYLPDFGLVWSRVPHSDGLREWWLRPGPVVFTSDAATVSDLQGRGTEAHHVAGLGELDLGAAMVDMQALAVVLEARGLVRMIQAFRGPVVTRGIRLWDNLVR